MTSSNVTRRSLAGGIAAAAISCAARPLRGKSPRAVVHVVDDIRHHRAIESALSTTNVLASVRPGDRVLVKVNSNSGDPYPYSTSPALVAELCRRLADCGAKVVVGDRSFWGDHHTLRNLELNGIAPAARRGGARVVAFEPGEIAWQTISPERVPSWRGTVRIPALVRESDHVIHLPCIKTHFITGYTMALKNALGLVHPRDRARPGNLRSHHPTRIYQQIAEINGVLPRTAWHIADGHRALVTGGPTPQSGARPSIRATGLLVSSRDPVALDAVGIAVLRLVSPKSEAVTKATSWTHPMIRAAIRERVGITNSRQLEVRGGSARLGQLAKS